MTVSTKDIYGAIAEFRSEVTNRMDKIDDRLQVHGEHLARVGEHLKAQNGRMGKVESKIIDVERTALWSKIKLMSYSAIISAFIGILGIAATTKSLGLW